MSAAPGMQAGVLSPGCPAGGEIALLLTVCSCSNIIMKIAEYRRRGWGISPLKCTQPDGRMLSSSGFHDGCSRKLPAVFGQRPCIRSRPVRQSLNRSRLARLVLHLDEVRPSYERHDVAAWHGRKRLGPAPTGDRSEHACGADRQGLASEFWLSLREAVHDAGPSRRSPPWKAGRLPGRANACYGLCSPEEIGTIVNCTDQWRRMDNTCV